MTIVGVLVLFVGLVVAGAGAGLALFERIPARGSLRLMGLGSAIAVVGLAVTLLSADANETLDGATYVPLVLVVAIVGYAAWYASTSDRGDGA